MKKLLFFLIVFALAACQQAPVPTSKAPEATQAGLPEATEVSAPAETEVPSGTVSEVPREQTVIFENWFGRVAIPDNMNPYIAGQYLLNGFWQANQESLFYLNYETNEIVPWQASGYSFNADNTEVTINIREGVKWGDGEPFTADDVIFTVNMLKAHPELQYSADMNQWVKDVVAKDPHTVVFTLTSPNPRFILDYFSVQIWETLLISPKHVWDGKDPLTFTNYDLDKGWPLGTGPYHLVRSTETETVWDLNDTWWGAETGFNDMPAPKRAIWVAVGSEDVRAAMAVDNELDATLSLARSVYEGVKAKNPNWVTWTKEPPYGYVDPCPRDLVVNDAVEPFKRSNVRWAINYAINRDQLIQISVEGIAEPAVTMFPPYKPFKDLLDRNQELFTQYPVNEYNPEKTVELMTAEGFTKDSQGFWVGADGKRITFTILVPTVDPEKAKMAPGLVEQLTAAGFEVTSQILEWAIMWDDMSSGNALAGIQDLCASAQDPYKTFALYHSRWSGPVGKPLPGINLSRFENPEYDALVDQMAPLPADDPAFNPLADQLLAIWVKELPVIPLTQYIALTPYNETYWTNWPTVENNYFHPNIHWWITGNMLLHNIKPAK